MNKELKKRIFTSIILLSLLTAMYFYTFIMIGSMMIIAIIIWIEFYALISKIIKGNRYQDHFFRYISKSASLLYLSIFVYFIFIIESDYTNLKIYLLYTKISPNKTISGSIGSIVLSMVLIPIFYNELIIYDLFTLIILTIVISLISQIGDLFISFLKRKAKVKDTSDLLPGHGGLLDRVDGIIFAVPLGILLLNFLN